MTKQFAVSFDYRCPFARNGHEAVVAGLRAGRDWDVRFLPFSLDQVHVAEGETPVWDRDPDVWGTGVLALCWGIAVRDSFADHFWDWHIAAFAARHDEGRKIAKDEVLREIATSVGLDADAVAAEVASGRPLKVLADEHTEADKRWSIFGVPTFVVGEQAAFVRVMDRANPTDVDRVLDLLEWTDLNEFKHTSVPREFPRGTRHSAAETAYAGPVRMSDTEAIMWAVEKDPALRSDFCNLTILDRIPDVDRMRHTMARAVAAIPRLGQRVVGAPLRIVPPAFADDPTLDLSAHVRRIALPGDGSERALLDLCGALAEQPLDRARPLWEFTIIEGLHDGRAALLQKIHHTITDGVGGLRLSLAFVDFEPDATPRDATTPDPDEVDADEAPTHEGPHDTPLRATRTAVVDMAVRNARMAHRLLGGAGHVLTHPMQLPGRAVDTARMARSIQRQALNTEPARSDVMYARSLSRHFEIHALSLPDVQAAAHALGGSINDLYVAGLAGALGRYHEHLGSDVAELRLAMPISTRDRGDDAANRFVPARVVVPIQPVDDPRALFTEVRARLATARGEAAIRAAEGLAGLLTGLPTAILVAMTRAQTRTTDFAATNLRGSPLPLYIAGARVLASYPFGPRTGTALNATVMSYCEDLHLGLNIDPAAIADVKLFMSDIDASFDAFLAFA